MIALIASGLLYGSLYSLLMSALVLGSMRWHLEIWYEDFPDPIKARIGPMSERAKRQRRVVAPLLAVLTFGLPLVALWHIGGRLDGATGSPFLSRASVAYLILATFHLVDLLLIDCLLGMAIDPAWLRLPGTEQGPHHWTFAKHARDFARAMAATIPVALLVAGVSLLGAPTTLLDPRTLLEGDLDRLLSAFRALS